MPARTGSIRARGTRKLRPDEALIALFIGAMNANGHVAPDELRRAHHLIWSTRRFRRKSGETVGRLIDRMKTLLEERDAAAVLDTAARSIPAALRAPAFAIVADLLLADGRIDAQERRFLRRLAVNVGIDAAAAAGVIDVMLLKNRL